MSRAGKLQEIADAAQRGEPFSFDERNIDTGPQPPPPTVLTGELQSAYLDLVHWSRELEGKFRAWKMAEEQHRVALAKFMKLSTGG